MWAGFKWLQRRELEVFIEYVNKLSGSRKVGNWLPNNNYQRFKEDMSWIYNRTILKYFSPVIFVFAFAVTREDKP